MGEDDLGILVGQFSHVVHVAIGVAEDDLAAGFHQLAQRRLAGAVLAHIGLNENLIVA